MASMPEPFIRYPRDASTTWIEKPGRLAPALRRHESRLASIVPFKRPKYRDARKPLHAEIAFVGKADSVWHIRSRGIVFEIPGHVCFHDAMNLVNGIIPPWYDEA